MQIIRQPSPWNHLAVFDNRELLEWLDFYGQVELPKWQDKLRAARRNHACQQSEESLRNNRSVFKDFHRTLQMHQGLEDEARKRGLIP